MKRNFYSITIAALLLSSASGMGCDRYQPPPEKELNPLLNYALEPFRENHQWLCQDRDKRWYATKESARSEFSCVAAPEESWEIPADYVKPSWETSGVTFSTCDCASSYTDGWCTCP